MHLRDYMIDRYGDVNQKAIRDFSEKVGCSIYAVRKWLSRERRPRPATQKEIFRVSKGAVTATDWWD